MRIPSKIYICVIAFSISACSNSEKLTKEFSVLDLGGSNMAIVNKDGSNSVTQVTSYYVSGENIFFEKNGSKDYGDLRHCEYGLISAKSHDVVYTSDNGLESATIKRILSANSKEHSVRSCADNTKASMH